MERKRRNKGQKGWRAYNSGQGQFCPGNGSSNADISGVQSSQHTGTFASSLAAVTARTNAATASWSQCDYDRTGSRTKTSPRNQGGKWHTHNETWTVAGKGRQPDQKHRGGWRDDRNGNYRDTHRKNAGVNAQGRWQDERRTAEETQRRPGNWQKNHYQADERYGREASNQTTHEPRHSEDISSNDSRHNTAGWSGGAKNRRGQKRRHGRNRHANDSQYESSSGPSADSAAPAASTSLDIPGFYYDPEKKRYFKIQSSNYVQKDDKNIVTHESIRKKQAETQRQKDVAAFKASSKQTSVLSSSSVRICRRPRHNSLSSMLLHGYQRGEVSRSALERAWILNSAPRIQQTGNCAVSPSFLEDLHVEHMLQMEISKDHDQLLCLWSLSGTTVQRLKMVDVGTAHTQSRTLSAQFTSSPHVGDFQSWNKITSLCWSEFPQHPDKKFVLYTTMCHTGQVSSLAHIRCVEEAMPAGFDHLSYNLGRQAIWTCAWNYHKGQFGVGTEKGCVIIDARTRFKWQFNTMNSDVLAQIFSKEDGGTTMYTGIRRGSILQHDLRTTCASPVSHSAMNHQSSVCCLRLSPEETYLYASDFQGGIKKWDLRMRKEVLTYDGLFNLQCKLPFHIDETQSLLYAAGQDCYIKIWCLKTGKLLLTIPPPYEASLYSIPAVCFSTRWGGLPGNMGLIMGAHKHFYLYSVQSCEE